MLLLAASLFLQDGLGASRTEQSRGEGWSRSFCLLFHRRPYLPISIRLFIYIYYEREREREMKGKEPRKKK